MIKTIETLPYEICNVLQDFLLRSAEFETFLNTLGYTNNESTETLKQVEYYHYHKNVAAIESFPFIHFASYESEDNRTKEDGFGWNVEILIGIKDLDEEDINQRDYVKTVDENVTKYIKSAEIQRIAKEIIKTIGYEIDFTGIQGDFEIEFGRITQLGTRTGEFDPMYHEINFELISYKEI